MEPEAVCKLIVEAAKAETWSWDARFGAVLATFPKTNAAPIERALTAFENSYGPDTAGTAPEIVQRILSKYGGLRSGQRFYVSGATAEQMLYAAWWPYASGDPISLRVRLVQPGSTPEIREKLDANMKTWFGVSPPQ